MKGEDSNDCEIVRRDISQSLILVNKIMLRC